MRSLLLLLLVATAVGAGCAGKTEEPPQAFTAADAKRLSAIAPSSSEWDWPGEPSSTGTSDPDEEVPKTADDPNLAALYDTIRDLEELGGASSKWIDDDKLAHLNVSAMATAFDAHASMKAYREFLHAWGETGVFGVTKDEDVDGLGDEAWVIWIVGNGNQVTYQWRTGNLITDAHMHCYRICPTDVDGAAREWAEAVAAAARAGGD